MSPGEVFLVLDGAEPEVDLQLGLDLEAAGARPPATRRLHSQWSRVIALSRVPSQSDITDINACTLQIWIQITLEGFGLWLFSSVYGP